MVTSAFYVLFREFSLCCLRHLGKSWFDRDELMLQYYDLFRFLHVLSLLGGIHSIFLDVEGTAWIKVGTGADDRVCSQIIRLCL
jgi:hypothetical protein